LSFKPRYGFITLYITDNGDGISDANKDKVFSSFFTTKREDGGTGLGLDIVSSLLLAHNGVIELQNNKKETTFAVTLPISIAK
ncbi:MAG: HAMP domain-containing sensor histidine kinase, partial [Emcibacteraceae bacterium]|nr:HAMP domain-containing sensor histidine kinase [Emcibacteraceae bacterium]